MTVFFFFLFVCSTPTCLIVPLFLPFLPVAGVDGRVREGEEAPPEGAGDGGAQEERHHHQQGEVRH